MVAASCSRAGRRSPASRRVAPEVDPRRRSPRACASRPSTSGFPALIEQLVEEADAPGGGRERRPRPVLQPEVRDQARTLATRRGAIVFDVRRGRERALEPFRRMAGFVDAEEKRQGRGPRGASTSRSWSSTRSTACRGSSGAGSWLPRAAGRAAHGPPRDPRLHLALVLMARLRRAGGRRGESEHYPTLRPQVGASSCPPSSWARWLRRAAPAVPRRGPARVPVSPGPVISAARQLRDALRGVPSAAARRRRTSVASAATTRRARAALTQTRPTSFFGSGDPKKAAAAAQRGLRAVPRRAPGPRVRP